MPSLLELAIIFAVLVAPGLVTVYLAREASPSPDPTPDPNAMILSALSIALVLAAVEVFVLSLASWSDDRLRVWGGFQLSELASSDRWKHFEERPGQIAVIASTEYLGHLAILAALGWFDPLGRLLRSQHEKAGLTKDDPFVEALTVGKQKAGVDDVYARIAMKSGREYSGTIQSVSFRPNADGSRDVLLQNVQRLAEGNLEPLDEHINRTGALLNTRELESIELIYPLAPASTNEDNADDVLTSVTSSDTVPPAPQ